MPARRVVSPPVTQAVVGRVREWAFPEARRQFPGTRALSISLRTIHLAAVGLLLGGHAFSVEEERLAVSLALAVLSGLGLVALEIYAVGLYWLVQGKGILVLVKLGLLLLIPFFWESRVVILLLVVCIASVGSHMPARLRHYSLVRSRAAATERALASPPLLESSPLRSRR